MKQKLIQGAAVGANAATTATGINAIDSATLNAGATAGFAASGSALLGGVEFTYTALTGTSFTGCGVHAATTGGETIAIVAGANTHASDDFICEGDATVGVSLSFSAGVAANLTAYCVGIMSNGKKLSLGAITIAAAANGADASGGYGEFSVAGFEIVEVFLKNAHATTAAAADIQFGSL